MIYELRHYVPTAGMEDRMRERFARDSLPLFKNLGIALIDFWEAPESDEIWYVVEWPDEKAAKTGWKKFVQTPEWKEIAARTENDGPLSTSRAIVLKRPDFVKSEWLTPLHLPDHQ
ncbi:MAG: NIPSNAP family protein [Mesorhizobium sp.]|uniref:NIPSNAP family protein n=1 Tax=Mesorhizobium sp. TaxID=1871066 RepID=UPI0012032FA0|nr:NIPSNAP family protein [Mesorhizobium sp.]TIL87774.1 MAG: NIPSNAP family protein [Mesorhizobium sp.]TIR29774.1 MAG: NIPSNAP family protein [Mesorhizobium sp.]